MWNNHKMYFGWASGIRLTPINIYINDLEVNIKSLHIKFANGRRTGRVVSIGAGAAFTQRDLNHLKNCFTISRGMMPFVSVGSAKGWASFHRRFTNLGSENRNIWVSGWRQQGGFAEQRDPRKLLGFHRPRWFSDPEVNWHSLSHVHTAQILHFLK